jgi:hypothetical protein
MHHVHMEELETRQLLNGTVFELRLPPAQAFAVIGYDFRMTGLLHLVDYGWHSGPIAWGRLGQSGMAISVFWEIGGPGFGGRGPGEPGLPALARPSPGAGGPGPEAEAAWFSRDHAGPGFDAAARPPVAGGNVPAIPPAPPTTSGGANGAAQVLLGMTLERSLSQPRSLLESPGSGQGFAVEPQGLFASRLPLRAVPAGEVGRAGTIPGQQSGDSNSGSGTPVTSQDAKETPLPSPQVSGALTFLPALDLSALEVGMQEFLEQLENFGPRLVREGDATLPPWPWIVAVTAAATACEIARRELRRPTGVPDVEADGMAAYVRDRLFAG